MPYNRQNKAFLIFEIQSKMKIATILLNYNSADDCKKCIGHLLLQQRVQQEIIVVDNCSRDEEKRAIELFCKEKGITFIANSTNSGYNAGNNAGLRYAAEQGYEYALIANPDMEFPQKDYIYKLLQPMIDDKEIVVCGSDIVGLDGKHQSPMYRDGNWRDSWGWLTGIFKKQKADTYDFIDNYNTSHYCAKVSGCCLAVRLSFIKSIGFFDEYPLLYCEEAILSRQVEQAGKRMYYTTEAQAIHAHRKSEKGNPVKRFRQWRRSRLYYIKRYSGDTAFGRFMASLSLRIHMGLMITYSTIMRLCK